MVNIAYLGPENDPRYGVEDAVAEGKEDEEEADGVDDANQHVLRRR